MGKLGWKASTCPWLIASWSFRIYQSFKSVLTIMWDRKLGKSLTQLGRIRDKFYHKYQFSKPMVFREKEQEKGDVQDSCYICKDKFGPEHERRPKVRDHCHFTGVYRGV